MFAITECKLLFVSLIPPIISEILGEHGLIICGGTALFQCFTVLYLYSNCSIHLDQLLPLSFGQYNVFLQSVIVTFAGCHTAL